jgi:hypothetical protein
MAGLYLIFHYLDEISSGWLRNLIPRTRHVPDFLNPQFPLIYDYEKECSHYDYEKEKIYDNGYINIFQEDIKH